MATPQGQTKKDVIKSARKKPVEPTKPAEEAKPAEVEEGDLEDPYSQASTDSGSLDTANYKDVADKGDQSVFDQPSTMRQDFFNEMKKKSQLGRLTPEMYGKAKEQLMKYEGVTGEEFESTMSKNLIRPSNFVKVAPAESKEEAVQNVMFQRQYGTGLGTLAAMQDPKYKEAARDITIKTSPLRMAAQPIGPASGKAEREARRAAKRGDKELAKELYAAAASQRLREPAIDTPLLRGIRMAGKIAAAKEARKQDIILSETEKRAKEMEERRKKLAQPRAFGLTEQKDTVA